MGRGAITKLRLRRQPLTSLPGLIREAGRIYRKRKTGKIDAYAALKFAFRIRPEDCTLVAWHRFLYAPRAGGGV
jgi:hypothetical protein